MSERILVFLPNDLSGIVLAEPTVRSLKMNIPKAKIYLVAPKKWIPLVTTLPGVEEVFTATFLSPLNLFQFWKRRIHRVIFLKPSFFFALWTKISGIRKRVGYRQFGITWLLNRRVRKLPEKYQFFQVRQFVELIRFFGCQIEDRNPQWPLKKTFPHNHYLVTQGAHEKLDKNTIHSWEKLGFEIIDPSTSCQNLIKKIKTAKLIVGPPDSITTLAQATSTPCIRLSSQNYRYDEIPGIPAFVASPTTNPEEVLKNFNQFQKEHSDHIATAVA